MSTLKELRSATGMSQSEVSKIINVQQSNYSAYESGVALPCLEDMVVLEKRFSQRIDWDDSLSEQNKLEIVSGLVNLCSLYPINQVLVFAQHALREGIRIGKPGLLIKNYSEIACKITHEVAPMLPPDVIKK